MAQKKQKGQYLLLNRIDKKLGFVREFVKKDSVLSVSRVIIDGQMGSTAVGYITRSGKYRLISVIEDPKSIFYKLGT